MLGELSISSLDREPRPRRKFIFSLSIGGGASFLSVRGGCLGRSVRTGTGGVVPVLREGVRLVEVEDDVKGDELGAEDDDPEFDELEVLVVEVVEEVEVEIKRPRLLRGRSRGSSAFVSGCSIPPLRLARVRLLPEKKGGLSAILHEAIHRIN